MKLFCVPLIFDLLIIQFRKSKRVFIYSCSLFQFNSYTYICISIAYSE